MIFVDLLDHDCSAFERPKSEGMRWRESWMHEVCIETVFKDFVLDSKFSPEAIENAPQDLEAVEVHRSP